MKVLAFGEILFDIIEGKHYLGGAPLNFAAHLAQLGAESYIYSRVGEDELAKSALAQIRALGVSTTFVQRDTTHPTGTVPVEFIAGQPNYTILEEVAYDFMQYRENQQRVEATAFSLLYYGTLAQRAQHSRNTLKQLVDKKEYKHIFYDVNLRKNSYTHQVIQNSLKQCTILKLNDEEVEVLSNMLYSAGLTPGSFSEKVAADYQISLIIITAGAKGCYLFEKNNQQFVAGYPANVVDTVGAGDAFSAAFVYYYLKTEEALQAADRANRLGAFVASARGPLPAYTPEIKKALMTDF